MMGSKSKKSTDSEQKSPKKASSLRRSFRLTRKQDLPPALRLVSVRKLLRETFALLRQEWKLFVGLGALYGVSYRILVDGVSRLDLSTAGSSLSDDTLNTSDKLIETALVTGNALDSSSSGGTISSLYATLLTVFFVLAVVWAVRQLTLGRQVRIRDALYNCGAPILPVLGIMGIIFLQLLPMVMGIFIYLSATTNGIAQSGAENMAIFIVAALATLLSCYWLSSSIIGLMAVTLPGMYPMAALKAAKELVRDRRWQVFLRILIFAVFVVICWFLIVIATALNPFTAIFVTDVVTILRAVTLIISSVLLYKLYRSLVDETKN